ncbi:hypothetical protein B0H14DRAFT_2594937 [Mycena olivaceomarginata]|nr:hypothetical protein B0H14DRAFT_2594937 [Mycena olivaceomarginata]
MPRNVRPVGLDPRLSSGMDANFGDASFDLYHPVNVYLPRSATPASGYSFNLYDEYQASNYSGPSSEVDYLRAPRELPRRRGKSSAHLKSGGHGDADNAIEGQVRGTGDGHAASAHPEQKELCAEEPWDGPQLQCIRSDRVRMKDGERIQFDGNSGGSFDGAETIEQLTGDLLRKRKMTLHRMAALGEQITSLESENLGPKD